MPKKEPKLQTWQIFYAARKHLGPEKVTVIFGKKNARTVYMWAQDPAYTEDRSRDPLESLSILFSKLDEIGRADIARRALAYLANIIGLDETPPSPDECKPTIQDEILYDYKAISLLQQAIAEDSPLVIIDELSDQAIEEIERTRAKYHLDHKGD